VSQVKQTGVTVCLLLHDIPESRQNVGKSRGKFGKSSEGAGGLEQACKLGGHKLTQEGPEIRN
jgi:hypothetical protein